MKKHVVIDKKTGETPLQAIESWKACNPEYAHIPASYAGRLDPMASGKLLVLLGDECKKQKDYTGLDKEYEVEILFDVGSDTGDALGIVRSGRKDTRIGASMLRHVLSKEVGAHMRQYPAYSSKTVHGKPLFLYALEGKLDTIDIPTHEERIYKITLLEEQRISKKELEKRIEEFLSLTPTSDEPSKALGADFRITEVRAGWQKIFEMPDRSFSIARIRVTCASGTYMRSLAGRIGEALSTQALALSIHRTKIGKYWNGFWLRNF